MNEDGTEGFKENAAEVKAAGVSKEDRLYKTVAAVLGISADELSEATSPGTTSKWDSLNHLFIVMALESEFGLSLSPEDALEMRTVGAIRDLLRKYGVEI